MHNKDIPNLLAIKEAIRKITEFVAEHFDGDSLFSDSKSFDAVLMNFIVIGESVMRISQETKEKNLEIPWQKVRGFRNLVAHNYFGVDAEEVFEIIKNDLPILLKSINNILKKHNKF